MTKKIQGGQEFMDEIVQGFYASLAVVRPQEWGSEGRSVEVHLKVPLKAFVAFERLVSALYECGLITKKDAVFDLLEATLYALIKQGLQVQMVQYMKQANRENKNEAI